MRWHKVFHGSIFPLPLGFWEVTDILHGNLVLEVNFTRAEDLGFDDKNLITSKQKVAYLLTHSDSAFRKS